MKKSRQSKQSTRQTTGTTAHSSVIIFYYNYLFIMYKVEDKLIIRTVK